MIVGREILDSDQDHVLQHVEGRARKPEALRESPRAQGF